MEETMTEEWVTWEEAVDLIAQRTGQPRGQAKASMTQAIRDGKIVASVGPPETDLELVAAAFHWRAPACGHRARR
jgi:hypothetical protein